MAKDPRRKGMPQRPPLTGPQYQFARELIVESLREVSRGRAGLCTVCRVRSATVAFGKVIPREQVRGPNVPDRKYLMQQFGVCAPCARRPDVQERLEEISQDMLRDLGSTPVFDIGDLPCPYEFEA